MLKRAALELGQVMHQLGMVEAGLDQAMRMPGSDQGNVGALAAAVMGVLDNLKRVCILSDLDDMLPEIDRFAQSMQAPNAQDIYSRARHLRERLQDELGNEYYFQIRREHVQFYDQVQLFGEKVTKAFPDATSDIRDAGNCLALEQPIATIFHLMRAVEIAINKLAKRRQLTVNPRDTWGLILNNLTASIQKMPDKTAAQKAKKERWSELRTALFHLKEAWRDNSLHARRKHATLSEAREIFDTVRVFMQKLAAL